LDKLATYKNIDVKATECMHCGKSNAFPLKVFIEAGHENRNL